MSINIIVAMAKNRVIGLNNKLPWSIPNELKYFKKTTTGNGKNAIIFGRKTWDDLPKKPLPKRTNYILSNKLNYQNIFQYNQTNNQVSILNEPDEITNLKKEYDDIWICGGEKIYDYYIDKSYINKIYVTKIDYDFKGDTFFSKIPDTFNLTHQTKNNIHQMNALTYFRYRYEIYENNITNQ